MIEKFMGLNIRKSHFNDHLGDKVQVVKAS